MIKPSLRKIFAVTAVSLGSVVAVAGSAWAVTTKNTGLDQSAMMVYGHVGGEANLATTIGTIVNGFLGLLGIVFVILIIYGGVLWMTARGNQEIIKKAQGTLTGAAIGFIIIMGAYAISDFVITAIVDAALSGTPAASPTQVNEPPTQ